MDTTLAVNKRQVSERAPLSTFAGLAVLCILVAGLIASTYIQAGEGAQAPSLQNTPPGAFQSDSAPAVSVTFYLFDSEAQLEEMRDWVELGADLVGQIPLQAYPHAVLLVAHKPDQEALAYARIVECVRSSTSQPERIEVVDLREQKLK
jgi:hypothetical protein